ncbi:MAG: hypothetical protein U5K84_10045 [Alkalibacterium sp.]|nr:hypothetical protein [Alkalibacterium sp.]
MKWNPPDSKSYKGYNRLEGRNALITGGDSGIGRRACYPRGANVAISSSRRRRANDVRDR